MIGKGRRRGNPKQLADHILNADNNEEIFIREIEGYPAQQFDAASIRKALGFMEVQGKAKGKSRLLYHAILAPSDEERLTPEQLKQSIMLMAKNLDLSGHSYVAVEHWKHNRQHFHIVLSILNPKTGKQVDLKFDRRAMWNTARQLEEKFGLKPVISKGRSAQQWEVQRGRRGLDPLVMRKQITEIYKQCKTGKEFHVAVKAAGYILAKGDRGAYLLVDKFGDHHGVLRRIQGVTNKQFRLKFKDLKDEPMLTFASIKRKRQSGRMGKSVIRQVRQSLTPLPRSALYTFAKTSKNVFCRYKNIQTQNAAHYSRLVQRGVLNHTKVSRPSAQAFRQKARPIIEEIKKAFFAMIKRRKHKISLNPSLKKGYNKQEAERAELIAWAIENGRWDILLQFGFFAPENPEL